jgi:long-chain acyl-CoA synthetase
VLWHGCARYLSAPVAAACCGSPGRTALREKYLGIWQSWTWRQTATEVREMAMGLASLGFRRGDNLAIIGDNRPRLYMAFAARNRRRRRGADVSGCRRCRNDLRAENATIQFAIVEDQEQVDKLLEARETLPQIGHIIYEDHVACAITTRRG